MTPVNWRRAVPGDEPALSALGAATFLTTFAHDHPGGPLLQFLAEGHSHEFYTRALTDPDKVLILGETPLGAPVAYAMVTPPEHPAHHRDGDIELKRIYVLPGWQGAGHADTLFDMVEGIARERGANRLLLAVYENNARAQAFYRRKSFVEIGTTVFMVGDLPFDDRLWAKDL